jgi:hypothetical protein
MQRRLGNTLIVMHYCSAQNTESLDMLLHRAGWHLEIN